MSEIFLDNVPRELREKVLNITNANPSTLGIFEELYNYAKNNPENRKKSRSDILGSEVAEESIIFQLKDVSVLTPFRKKLNLVFSISPTTGRPTLSLSKDMAPQLTLTELGRSIKFATFLPFPEKTNVIYLFISYSGPGQDPSVREVLLLTLNKDATLLQLKNSGLLASGLDDFAHCVEYIRKQAILVGFRISDPFSAANAGPRPFYVEAHRGTKEGTLYFLPDHVIFGFKKPILMFSSQEIESITYSSITRLTFNVTLTTKDGEKFEFSMIDQNEYTLIDDYVKRKQVIDNSMSEENKAKTAHKDMNSAEQSSLLAEAAQQIEDEGNINDIPLESDDEEADNDFEADSNASDGSDTGSNSDDDNQDEEDEEDEGVEEDIEDEEDGGDLYNEEQHNAQLPNDGQDSWGGGVALGDQFNGGNVNDNQFGLHNSLDNAFGGSDFNPLAHDASLTVEKNVIDDEEDSGVEYD
ncbi:LADA_0G06964g1_1 [Lachancea dasiensis]|uniref:Histone chaperone RTT106 n=1 Tax=Lachancea dasiensis TaxID=1072105 RepID=A0A1G4JTE6_9SACH|nr:LADA_0G06964g1_1 [Lachancea dasiensis]